MFNGKINYQWPFSIAMLNYQRVINNKNDKMTGDTKEQLPCDCLKHCLFLNEHRMGTCQQAGDLTSKKGGGGFKHEHSFLQGNTLQGLVLNRQRKFANSALEKWRMPQPVDSESMRILKETGIQWVASNCIVLGSWKTTAMINPQRFMLIIAWNKRDS